ncbi:MAG: phage tail-like protein [Kiritimatiellia bacterium]|jgi:phage tail-like protein
MHEDFYPYGNFYFSLEIDGVEVAHFLEFSGLKTSGEVYDIPEGGMNNTVHKRPSQSKWENLTLKYATSASNELMIWRDKYLRDDFSGREGSSGAIVMYNNKREELRRYSFHGAWPVSWQGPDLNSGGSALAVETLEIAFDTLYIDGAKPPEPGPAPEPEPEPDPKEPLYTADIPFKFDSDEMKEPKGSQECKKVADSINSQDPPPPIVYIDAHTCTMGTYAYNLSLSKKRALATASKMSDDCPDTKFVSAGFSYAYPTASNATAGGRAANRRTEFFDTPAADRGRHEGDPGEKPKGP